MEEFNSASAPPDAALDRLEQKITAKWTKGPHSFSRDVERENTEKFFNSHSLNSPGSDIFSDIWIESEWRELEHKEQGGDMRDGKQMGGEKEVRSEVKR